MSKFTKGKWRVKYNPIIQGIFDEDNKPIQLNEANARLIAAAPEMYEMMKNASNYILECAKLYSPFPDELCMYAERTKELIARIDGEDEWLRN